MSNRLVFGLILVVAPFAGCNPAGRSTRLRPVELRITVRAPGGRTEFVVADADRIERLWLRPTASAKAVGEAGARDAFGRLRLVFEGGSSEDVELLRPLGRFRRGNGTYVADLTELGKYLETAAESSLGLVRNAGRGGPPIVLRGHRGRIAAVAFSPDGETLATMDEGPALRLWDRSDGMLRSRLHPPGAVHAVAFGPDRRTLAVASREDATLPICSVRLLDLETDRTVAKYPGGWFEGNWLAFSPDGRLLASTGQNRGATSGIAAGRAITIRDVTAGRVVGTLGEGLRWPSRLQFSPDGRTLAVADADRSVSLWDVSTGRRRAYHPGGREGGGYDGPKSGRVRLWAGEPEERRLGCAAHAGGAKSLAFSPGGDYLASGGDDNAVWVWEAATGRAWASFEEGMPSGWGDRSRLVVFRSAGREILSVGDRQVRVRDTATGRLIASVDLPPPPEVQSWNPAALSPDGRTFAGESLIGKPEAREPIVILWDLARLLGQ
jgi:WD40 repeat protein